MDHPSKKWGGWPLVGLVAALAAGGSGLILILQGTDAEATGVVLRYTARISFTCYLLAFIAAPLITFFRTSGAARWLRSNRRYLGVSFAASHAVHAVAILHIARLQPENYSIGEAAPGIVAYLFLAAMVATSFDATTRMLPPRVWKALHKTGMYYLGLIFFMTFISRVPSQPLYAIFLITILGAWGFRVAAYVATRKRRRVPVIGGAA